MSAFDHIISGLMADEKGAEMLAESLKFDASSMGRIPLRYRIIALGFVRRMTLDELNGKLEENGCARLYARSMLEAGLIYAFLHRLSYEEWKHLQEKCGKIRTSTENQDRFFKSASVGMDGLKAYVYANSEDEEFELATLHLTRMLEARIAEAATGRGGFEAFLTENIRAFSNVREKTRYYFCKYLYFALKTAEERYLSALEDGSTPEAAAQYLTLFKGITPLVRKKMTLEERKAFLDGCGISCGAVFDDFSYFFFEYVSLDWVQVLAEYYGSLPEMPKKEKAKAAEALKREFPKKYKGMPDEEIIRSRQQELDEEEEKEDEAYALDSKGRGYQKNRAGENTIRKYIKGTLDIDRTTLVCFLLYFDERADLPEEMKITPDRLTEILLSCGFPGLRMTDDFDLFVLGYLDAEDKAEYLIQEVTNYALDNENFYLYYFYRNSSSYYEDFEKLTGGE